MRVKEKDVMVTGGAGFIGSHLVDELVNKKERGELLVIDNLRSGDLSNLKESKKAIEFKKLDVREEFVIDLVEKKEIDIIFHLAANASVPKSVDNPRYDFETNALGTYNILEAARNASVEKLIYASTAAVYGEPSYTPIDETHSLTPISPYGASKLAGEKTGFAFHTTYDLPFVAMRIFNTYGPRQPRYVMYDFLKKLEKTPDQLEVLGTGKQVRSFCFVTDIVDGFIQAAKRENTAGEAFNIAGKNPIPIRKLAKLMAQLFGVDTEITYTGESWEGDIVKLIPDISKIQQRLDFSPTITLREGLRKLKEWFDENNRKIK